MYNYTWPLFPYIWNEIKFHVAYNADLEYVAATMQEVAEQEVGEAMMKQVRFFSCWRGTPVNQLEVQERPVVMPRGGEQLVGSDRSLSRASEGSGRVKSRLIRNLLARLNEEPDRVMFPKSNLR